MIGVGYANPKGKIPYSAKRDLESSLFINARIMNNNSDLLNI